ncbi:MAG: hypothetical protein R3277_04840 [Brumimicrobium sp.]|nr:hypothetical protein [Brumimicrobium sp.]
MKALIFIPLICSLSLFAQQNSEPLPEPPSKENTFHFTIKKFERQPLPPNYLLEKFDDLSKRPRSTYSKEDSLYLGYHQVHKQKFGNALSIFSRLRMDTISEIHAKKLYHLTLFKNKRLEELKDLEMFNKSNGILPKEIIRKRLIEVYILQKRKKWSMQDSTIFPILKDSILHEFSEGKGDLKEDLLPIAQNLDEVMRLFVLLNDGSDDIISQAYEEIGDFQYKYFYVSNAYIYYSIAVHYNKNNQSALEKMNRIKDEIYANNYLLPSFKVKFGKVISNRHQLKELDGDVILQDTSVLRGVDILVQSEHSKKKDYIPWLDSQVLIIIGLAVLLLFVVFGLSTNDRKKSNSNKKKKKIGKKAEKDMNENKNNSDEDSK